MFLNGHKVYIGGFNDEELGARVHDICYIQQKGMDARINFNYSKVELLSILLFENIICYKERAIQ